jgi:moderate conductance mechanosensitive channel
MSAQAWDTFIDNLMTFGLDGAQALIRVALVVIAGYLIIKLVRNAFVRLEHLLITATEKRETPHGPVGARIRTLSSVLWTIANGFLWFIVVLIVLSQFGINVGPILAGAGVFGLAAGLGVQHLVRDLVSGFFLILEDQIRVGDTAIINGITGLVEAVTFRTVILRDQAGVVHVFPNGMINTLANATMGWSASVIDVVVPAREDPDRIMAIMRRVGDQMSAEAEYERLMLEPVEIFGLENFTDATLTLRARVKTLPTHQHSIGREYRRRLKKAFDAEGVATSSPAPAVARPATAATPT